MLRYKAKLEQCIVSYGYFQTYSGGNVRNTALIFGITEEFFNKVTNRKDPKNRKNQDSEVSLYNMLPVGYYGKNIKVTITEDTYDLLYDDPFSSYSRASVRVAFTKGHSNSKGDEIPPFADVEVVMNKETVLRVLIPMVRSYFTERKH